MTGLELKALRLSWEMSQRQFAEFIGYHPQVVSELERGKKPVPKMLSRFLESEAKLREAKKILQGA